MASIVLGEDDEQVLRTRSPKKVGPWAPQVCDPAGTYMRSLAEEHYNRVAQQSASRQALADDAKTLADTMDTNSKSRKREAAMKALAKRTPRKKARSAAVVAVAATS